MFLNLRFLDCFQLLVSVHVQCTTDKNNNHICAKIGNIFSKHPKVNMDCMERHMIYQECVIFASYQFFF
jgi:hypothetical protein